MMDLDANATLPLLPAAAEAMARIEAQALGNPSSAHALGRKARRYLDDAREQVAALLGAAPDEVVWTSGATEANNLALHGLSALYPIGTLLTSDLEHPCVREPAQQMQSRGWNRMVWPISERGIASVELPDEPIHLATLMLASHETGALQPVAEAVQKLAGVPLHCDAAQAIGKIPVHFAQLGCTTLSLSAHKFGGPKGIGALLVRSGTRLTPLLHGGGQQRGHRPGTESVALAVGLATALAAALESHTTTYQHLSDLRSRFWQQLTSQAAPVLLNGPELGASDVIPTTLNVAFPGIRADLLLMRCDLAGIACSAGAACASGSLLPSPGLRAMGLPLDRVRSSVRFSFSSARTVAEIEHAAASIAQIVRELRPAS